MLISCNKKESPCQKLGTILQVVKLNIIKFSNFHKLVAYFSKPGSLGLMQYSKLFKCSKKIR